MAEETDVASPYQPVLLIVGLLAVLGVLWWMRGGPENGIPQNIFIAPIVPTPSGDSPESYVEQDIGGQ